MSSVYENLGNGSAEHVFSQREIGAYREGCEEIGLKLSEVVDKLIADGKKPTILIPSRGAIPIFLNAIDALRKGHDDGPLGDPARTHFYPDKIFQYLSSQITEEACVRNSEKPCVDVVLFPFTADVSLDPDVASATSDTTKLNAEAEKLAKALRTSCARSIASLLYGDRSSADLKWNFFLSSKISPEAFKTFGSSAAEVEESLAQIEVGSDREIVLIDTVLSGRAVSNISEAFQALGHPITPVFAVDSKDGRLQARYAEKIRRSINPTYITNIDDQLARFPLITEDKGASVLGLSALNIGNFNSDKCFRDAGFPDGFLPQSCLWLVPPQDNVSIDYNDVFHEFMNLCNQGRYTGPYAGLIDTQLRFFLGKDGSKQPEFTESVIRAKVKSMSKTSSGIITVKIDPKTAREWVEEFKTLVGR